MNESKPWWSKLSYDLWAITDEWYPEEEFEKEVGLIVQEASKRGAQAERERIAKILKDQEDQLEKWRSDPEHPDRLNVPTVLGSLATLSGALAALDQEEKDPASKTDYKDLMKGGTPFEELRYTTVDPTSKTNEV